MFTKIGSLLPVALKKNDMAPKVARARIFAIFEEAARAKLEESQYGSFKPLHLVGGTLTVACKSSPVAGVLRAAEAELKEAVARGGGRIEDIRFLLAPWR